MSSREMRRIEEGIGPSDDQFKKSANNYDNSFCTSSDVVIMIQKVIDEFLSQHMPDHELVSAYNYKKKSQLCQYCHFWNTIRNIKPYSMIFTGSFSLRNSPNIYEQFFSFEIYISLCLVVL